MAYTVNALTGKMDYFSNAALSIAADAKDPSGFVDPDNITVSYDETTQQVTLTHSSGSIIYYWQGKKKTLTSPWISTAHTNTTGHTYWLSSSDGVNFTWATDTAWNFYEIQVTIVVYNMSDKFCVRECHGMMQWQVHQETHQTIGTYRLSGGAPTSGTYALNTATDAATTPAFDISVVKDEDLSTTVPLITDGSYTTFRIGASSVATFDTTATFPFRSSGSYILVNDPLTGAEIAGAVNRFVNVYQIIIPAAGGMTSQKYRTLFLQPQTTFTSLASAKAEDPRSLSLGTLSTLLPEYSFYTRLTYSLLAANGNTGKCQLAGLSYILGTLFSQISGSNFVPAPVIFPYQNKQLLDADITIGTGYNAVLTGPINTNGYTITTQGTGVLKII